MENNTAPVAPLSSSKTTPKDFFLWLGAIIALYGSITSFIALVFEYINYSFPDVLAGYGDPYGGAVRTAMAALIVLVPTTIVLMHMLRTIILREAGKASIWVRRWAIGLTLFIATIAVLIDLVTLINTFLGGEVTVRFILKVLTVLVVALFIFFHTLADSKGYWVSHGDKARLISIFVSVVVLGTIIAGFFIIGTPSHVRMLRFDDQKVGDLQSIQYQLTYYYQLKRTLPETLSSLNDPLTNFLVPTDPQSKQDYTYEKTGQLSFRLCAAFNADSVEMKGRGATVSYPAGTGMGGVSENWQHGTGTVCFDRTIDPEKYPATTPTKPL